MKFLIELTFFIALIVRVKLTDVDAYTLEQLSNVNPDGSYSYVYRTSNGINAEENGVGGQYARGSFDFISKEGEPIALFYEADKNGYRPNSDILPTPPAIPEYIMRALEYVRNNPPQSSIK